MVSLVFCKFSKAIYDNLDTYSDSFNISYNLSYLIASNKMYGLEHFTSWVTLLIDSTCKKSKGKFRASEGEQEFNLFLRLINDSI